MGTYPSVAISEEASETLDGFVEEHKYITSRRQAASFLINEFAAEAVDE